MYFELVSFSNLSITTANNNNPFDLGFFFVQPPQLTIIIQFSIYLYVNNKK